MSARSADAAAGYKRFVQSKGTLTQQDINHYLVQAGHRPIAHRTYDHYHRLYKAGFRTYVPINRFDVFRAQQRNGRSAQPRLRKTRRPNKPGGPE